MAIATLPIVLSVVLAELAIGGSFVMWLVDRGGRAPSGFLKLVAFVDAGAIAAALALVPTFPGGDLAARAGVDTGPLAAFGQALVLVTILIVIQLVTTFLPVRGLRLAAGLVTFLGGVAALGVIAIARPAQNPFDPLAIAALPFGAVALGGTDGAMLLGHWYLVQPGLRRALLDELVTWVIRVWPIEVGLLLVPTGMISVLNGSVDDGWGGTLGWFWVACAVATLVLALVTRAALKERQYSAVMAATGLLYLAILTAFGTDLVARAVLA